MFEARAAHRVPTLALLVLALAAFGCVPGRHTVRLRTSDGQARTTTPRPRPPIEVPKEEFHQAVRALARKVIPAADPLELTRQKFEIPVRGGVYVFNPRTQQIRPLDEAAAAREDLPPELVAQARGYLGWCESIHKHGDCLQILRNGGILDAHGRYAVAMAIAQGETIEATKESLKGMANPDAVMATLVSGMTMYMMLWVLPEPISKGIAAVVTVALVVYLGVDTLYTLAWGWRDLVNVADKATTFEELQKAGTDFGKVMGADTARILFMLATAALGSEAAGMAKIGPTLPGAAQASRLAVAEGGVGLEALGAVESVTITESGLTIALAPGAVTMSSVSDNFGRDRATGGQGRSTEPTSTVKPAGEPPARKVVIDEKQLQAKFKHAPDFGVTGNYDKTNAAEFSRAIERHVHDPAVRAIEGTYHRAPVIHYLDPSTGLNVMTDPAGNFISGWRLSAEQLQNVLAHGGL